MAPPTGLCDNPRARGNLEINVNLRSLLKMEAANRDLETKLTHVRITRDKTEGVLARRNANRIKRHKDEPILHCFFSGKGKAKSWRAENKRGDN